jgi:5'-deoxynucleotidase YfbR-like HD superfamily hydrolase
MGWIKDMWSKTKWARNAEDERLRKEEEAEMRKEILPEIKQDIKQVWKEKIKEEEIARIKGVKPQDKKTALQKIGEEFKQSNMGTTDKINQLLGKQNNTPSQLSQTKDYGKLIGGFNTEKNIPAYYGKEHKFRDDYGNIAGKANTQESKIKRMLRR